jgi:hypothetical protein
MRRAWNTRTEMPLCARDPLVIGQHKEMRDGHELERRHPWTFNIVGGALVGTIAAVLFRNPWALVVGPGVWAPMRVATLKRRGAV